MVGEKEEGRAVGARGLETGEEKGTRAHLKGSFLRQGGADGFGGERGKKEKNPRF